MRRWQFVLAMRELGYSEEAIGEVVAQRDQDRAEGHIRKWEYYLPDGYKDKWKDRDW